MEPTDKQWKKAVRDAVADRAMGGERIVTEPGDAPPRYVNPSSRAASGSRRVAVPARIVVGEGWRP